MPTFPTLTDAPTYPLKESTEDPVIKSNFEAGYVHTRARFTRMRHEFTLVYENLSNTDKETLDAFCDTVYGSVTSFTWVHPISGTSYTVRFDGRPRFESVGYDGSAYRWKTEFTLVQV